MNRAPSNASSASDESFLMKATQAKEEEKIKLAVQAIRKEHANWDRAKREFNSTISKSKQCDTTRGTTVEVDLEALVRENEKHDTLIVDFEAQYLRGDRLSDEDITKSAEACVKLRNGVKHGREKVSGLKAWFKMA